jgi:hypothetical protein
MNGVDEVPEEGEIDSNAPAPNKVHIRGLDRLNTYDIERYASEHYPSDLFQKVQWVDDTSANLIYDTPTAASEALAAFSVEERSEPLQIRAAKVLSTHPDVQLQVRQAIAADVKIRGAKDQSRFYLMNPRWDPDNPENERPSAKRRRPDDGYGHNKYRRRDYEYDRRQRGSENRQPQFHEDMYGDDPQAATDSRRNSSYSSNSEYDRSRRNRGQDLFASKQEGRLRNRSASPSRDEDGRYGFDDDQPYRQTARARSRTPPGIRGGRDNRGTRDRLRKELFPNRASSTALSNGHSNPQSRPSSSHSNKELFPDKLNGSVHRRQDAKHIDPDEVTKAIGQCSINNRVHSQDSFTYSSSGRRPEQNERSKSAGGDLFSRISGGPQAESSYGRLGSGGGGAEFNIKGASDAGFSILGASKERVQSPLVKELFPLKAGSVAKPNLFDGRIKGRAGRRRAEEYF